MSEEPTDKDFLAQHIESLKSDLAAARAELDDLKHDLSRLQDANSATLGELQAARKAICDSYQMTPWRWRFNHAQTIEAAIAAQRQEEERRG